ncbi:hypothetical protein KAI46_03285 [bacterium]|nr:hypothetical protein [bacterium]
MRRKKYSKLVTVCMDPLTYERVKLVVDRLGISFSEWFRKALVEKLEKEDVK